MTVTLSESLHRLIHSYKSEIKGAINNSDMALHVGHIRALKCVQRIPNCHAQSISQKMGLDKSQVTRMVKELHSKGHIEKRPNPDNHRSQQLVLTKSGKHILNTMVTLDEATSEKMARGLTEQQINDFKHYAEIITSNLCE
ncbi:MarR family winged helix-turn-helix transcriptional regulator [Marinomonas flavescens]|uniref:MarR family winged helix-turn-helix transcriptional regulator n=1 Tax=Marinomonas flavescens TaxID=2529379 RepID=UPI0010549C9C|nr:MarR family transcriptional regulator [Marinomonas flavescens]